MMDNRKKITFMCNDVRKRSFDFFKDMWKKKELCDITFHIGNDTVHAHKIIITAAIPYLRDILFQNDRQGEGEGISLPNIEPEAFRSIIEYSYTCKLEIEMDNAMDILSAACHLLMDEVKEACCDFLAENLDTGNFTSIRDFSSKLNCLELLTSIDIYIKQNFPEIVKTEQFLNWPVDFLKDIIGRNDLYVDNEQIILEAVIKWAKVCTVERKDELPDLLRKIRLHEVDPTYLVDIVEREEFIRTSLPIRDLIDEAKHYNFLPHRRKRLRSFPTKPRQHMKNTLESEEENNLCIYKLEVQIKHTLRCFDLGKELWEIKRSQTFFINDGSTAAVGKKMYFFYWGSTLQYDLANNSWKYLSDVRAPSSFMEAVALNGKIYVIGGMISKSASCAVRCFDPEMDVWTEVRPMRIGRWGASVVALSGYIFVLGGRSQSLVFDSVEKYKPEMNKWKPVQPMLTKRCFAGAASVNGKIYICGGISFTPGIECVATAEMYDPMRNRWTFVKPMNSARYLFTLLSCRSKLYAIGGQDREKKRQHRFVIYHHESDSWTTGVSTDSDYEVCGAVIMSAAND